METIGSRESIKFGVLGSEISCGNLRDSPGFITVRSSRDRTSTVLRT